MKYLYLLIAYIALGIAFLGVLLPGLPATEFFILSAWAAGKSSPKLHQWMMNHKLIGPPLRDWQQGGVVRKETKIIATSMMLLAAIMLAGSINHMPSLIITLLGMSAGALWMWSRPSNTPIENNR